MSERAERVQLHATCVAVGGAGVLVSGPSGSGKSDLALRLIDAGAVLVADDRVDVATAGDGLVASAPDAIVGMLEVRGLGIVRRPFLASVQLALAVDLVQDAASVPRLPESAWTTLLGVRVRSLTLAPFEASAAAKIRLALGLGDDDMVEPG